MSRLPRAVLCCAVALVLAGCRLDVTADLALDDDGTGQLTVTATVDADVVEQVPALAESLQLGDATAAGWAVEGPAPTDDGGLTVTVRHPVTSAEEATNVLASIGPPFSGLRVERTVDDDGRTVTTTLAGQLVLTGGFDAFADGDLLAAVGGTPFAEELAASGATPADTMTVVLDAHLPGQVESTTGEQRDGALRWLAPLDGSVADVTATAVQRPPATGWASLAATVALVALVAWTVVATAFIVSVARARARRRRQRRRPPRRPGAPDRTATTGRRVDEASPRVRATTGVGR